MKHDDDQIPDSIRRAAADYNAPPELSRSALDDMWSGIEAQAFGASAFEARQPVSGFRRFLSASNVLPLAAVLMLGVAIGRFALPRDAAVGTPSMANIDSTSGSSIEGPYQFTASRYLGQATALLAALPTEVSGDSAGEPYKGRAHDLLLTTRLLLDSPAAADPRFRTLLEDLELVLAQVVRLQNDRGRAALDLINEALEQRHFGRVQPHLVGLEPHVLRLEAPLIHQGGAHQIEVVPQLHPGGCGRRGWAGGLGRSRRARGRVGFRGNLGSRQHRQGRTQGKYLHERE